MTRRLLVTGLARDVETLFPREFVRLRSITSNFYDQVDFHVIESDSSDNTVKLLREIAKFHSNFSYESLGALHLRFPARIERLRHCRNRYVSFIRKNPDYFTNVMVVDFDIRNNRFGYKPLHQVLNTELKWDAIFANQTGRYFDIFALREQEWCPIDCMLEVNKLVERGATRELAKEQAIWAKMRKISPGEAPIKVDSAFGGMAIYRSWVFDHFDYSFEGTPISPQESEHVALHYKIRQAGGQMYIHPGFTNFGWNPHNLASYKVFRELDRFTKHLALNGFRRRIRSLLG